MEIKVKKELGYREDYKGIRINCSQDGVKLSDILEALKNFKDKNYLAGAFEQKNVQAYAKIGTRFHPLGFIPQELFNNYLKLHP